MFPFLLTEITLLLHLVTEESVTANQDLIIIMNQYNLSHRAQHRKMPVSREWTERIRRPSRSELTKLAVKTG